MQEFSYSHWKALLAVGLTVGSCIGLGVLSGRMTDDWMSLLSFALLLGSVFYLVYYYRLLNDRLIVSGHTLTVARRIGRSQVVDLNEVTRMIIRENPASLGFGKLVHMHLHRPMQTTRIDLSHLKDAAAFIRLIEAKLSGNGLHLAGRTLDGHESLPLRDLDELLR